jgi:hypothetical protein
MQRTSRQIAQENRQLKKQAAHLYDHERELVHSLKLANTRVRTLLAESTQHGYIPSFYIPNPFAPRPLGPAVRALPDAKHVPMNSSCGVVDIFVDDAEEENEYTKAVSIFELAQAARVKGITDVSGNVAPRIRVQSSNAHLQHRSGHLLTIRTLPTIRLLPMSDEFAQLTREVCSYPPYFGQYVFHKICAFCSSSPQQFQAMFETGISATDFLLFWSSIHHQSVSASDRVSRFWQLVCPSDASYVTPPDIAPLIEALIDFHTDLAKLRDDPMLRRAYTTVVSSSLFFSLHGVRSSRISFTEIKASNLVDAFYLVTSQSTRHVLPFSSSYFEDALKSFRDACEMPNSSALCGGAPPPCGRVSTAALTACTRLSPYILGRIFSHLSMDSDDHTSLSFDDYVWLWLAEKDKMSATSLSFWFRCLDADDDGYLSMEDIRLAYVRKMEVQSFPLVSGRRFKRSQASSPKEGSGQTEGIAPPFASHPVTPRAGSVQSTALGEFRPPQRKGTPGRRMSVPSTEAVDAAGSVVSIARHDPTYNPDYDVAFRPFVSTASSPLGAGENESASPVLDSPPSGPDDATMAPFGGSLQTSSVPLDQSAESLYGMMCSLIDFINPAEPDKISPIDIKRSGAGPAVFDVLISLAGPAGSNDAS